MAPVDSSMWKKYDEVFWGGDLRSSLGLDALCKRNSENKKVCQELEEYFKKRSRIEADYSKQLSNLAKCFKHKVEVGVMEAVLNKYKTELDTRSSSHIGVSTFFQQQSEVVKKFKDEQNSKAKHAEDALSKRQNAKVSQLSKTRNLEKTYVRKCNERDAAEANHANIKRQTAPPVTPKDIEKAQTKAAKAQDEAEKADTAYKSAVLVLDDCRIKWESEMETACQKIQELDEERLNFLRKELWVAVNVDSKLALDIDNSCESIRELLEKCDIVSDIQAFMEVAGTGENRPEPFEYKHYTVINALNDNDNSSNDSDSVYHTAEDLGVGSSSGGGGGGGGNNNNDNGASGNFSMKAMLTFPKALKKKSTSS